MKICLVTQNLGKLTVCKNVFGDRFELVPATRDFPEIQAESSLEIAKHTALEAAKEYNLPALREDHSLFLNFFASKLPGPYMKYFEKSMGVTRLLELMENYPDRTGWFELGTVLAMPDGKCFQVTSRVDITLKENVVVEDKRGGWSGVLCLKGEDRAFTEYPESERQNVWEIGFNEILNRLSESGYVQN